MHAAVDPTEKSKIGSERCDIGKGSITYSHRKNVISPNANSRGHFEPKHPEASTMLAQVNAIHPDLRYRVDAVEMNENLTASFTSVDKKMTTVEAKSAIIVVAAVLAVSGVPGVGIEMMSQVWSSKFSCSAPSSRLTKRQPSTNEVSRRISACGVNVCARAMSSEAQRNAIVPTMRRFIPTSRRSRLGGHFRIRLRRFFERAEPW